MVILLLDIFCEMDFSDSVNALITQHESFMRSNAVILSLFFKQKKYHGFYNMIVYKIRPSIYRREHEKRGGLVLKNDDDATSQTATKLLTD